MCLMEHCWKLEGIAVLGRAVWHRDLQADLAGCVPCQRTILPNKTVRWELPSCPSHVASGGSTCDIHAGLNPYDREYNGHGST